MVTGRIFKLGSFIIIISIFLVKVNSIQSFGEESRDYWPTDSWKISTPTAQNMSMKQLETMKKYIKDNNFAIDTILIVKNGYIVFEEYFNPKYNETTPHPIFSCTKSVISTFIGIAIDKGYIESLDQKILDFFPNQTFNNQDPRKENITVQHLLTMTSGLEWNEWDVPYDNPNNSLRQLFSSSNWIQDILDKPMIADPGTVWNYNTGEFHLLSALLLNATHLQGIQLEEFITNSIGVPMGSKNVIWEVDPQGIPKGGSGLHLTPREMAKFGFLYLNNGTWDNQQLITKDWITLSTTNYSRTNAKSDYGHGWWMNPELNLYYASGFAGQLIIPVPNYDMVVVFTSFDEVNWPYLDLLSYYIYASVEAGADNSVSIDGFGFVDLIGFIVVIGLVLFRKKRG